MQVLWVGPERSMESLGWPAAEALGRMGFGMVVLNDLAEARRRLLDPKIPSPTAVVVDAYDIGGWDGFPFVTALREDPRMDGLIIIVISTDDQTRHECGMVNPHCHAVRARSVGASAYHRIPLRLTVIADDIRRLTKPE